MASSVGFTSGMIGYSIRMSGPVFDGRATRAAEDLRDETERDGGELGVEMIRVQLDRVLQHPTGYYRSRITSEPQGGGTLIHDGGVIYGPWLEGTGSRNFPETVFRGYHTFRRMYPRINGEMTRLCEGLLSRKYIRRME